MNTVFTIGIFLCFFLQFLLLSKKNKSTTDVILAVWMFIFGINLFLSYLVTILDYKDIYPFLTGLKHPLPLLYGPMLYLYVLYSLKPDQQFTWKVFLHFAPVALSYLYLADFFFFYSVEQQLLAINWQVEHFSIFLEFSLYAFILSGIAYPIYSYSLLGKHSQLIQDNFAFNESINLNWLKYCIWGIGFIYLVVGLIVTPLATFIPFDFNASMIVYSLLILFVFFLGYFGIKHQGIFVENSTHTSSLVESASLSEYKRSGLKEGDALLYQQKLSQLMKTAKPYLEPKLTLSNLADELDISVNHLSQVINQYEEKNFFDFVNSYRVEEFKVRAVDPANSNFSILAIALDSGFNSKSSFNQVFKKVTGKTPSQFMANPSDA